VEQVAEIGRIKFQFQTVCHIPNRSFILWVLSDKKNGSVFVVDDMSCDCNGISACVEAVV
jgi:hypothetical protein